MTTPPHNDRLIAASTFAQYSDLKSSEKKNPGLQTLFSNHWKKRLIPAPI